jgi:hypothetical protein
MIKIICVMVLLAAVPGPAIAEVTVAPPQLDAVIQKIEARQKQAGTSPSASAQIIEKDGRVILGGNTAGVVYFNDAAAGIVKHFELKSRNDGYAFQAALQTNGRSYQRIVRKVNGADALVFFNDEEAFVYTQESKPDGESELKEWIYAFKPNADRGSQWTWVLKSEPWQWPLTVEMDENGDAVVSRNMPFAGIPIAGKARSQYMLDVMIKFKKGEPVKKYFPFSERVVSVPAVRYFNREGTVRPADVRAVNISVDDDSKPPPKVGLDFNRWDEHWRTTYQINVSANADEYPLLIE